MDARSKLILWLAGSSLDKVQTDEVLANSRVKFELEQDPVDAVGLLRALPYPVRPKEAKEQLEFLMVFEG